VIGLVLGAVIVLAGCGSAGPLVTRRSAETVSARGVSPGGHGGAGSQAPQPRPQVVEPAVGAQAPTSSAPAPVDPVGDPNAHAPPLSEVRRELQLEAVAVTPTTNGYINPLRYVTCCGRWERTDQGVDATMPAGAPILAPGPVKILAIEPDWYLGQPLVYWELLNGPDAGRVQYVAEEITGIAKPGSYLPQGGVIARFAASGTGIEFGWSTLNGITLAMATTGYEEGQVTLAGLSIRAWLNAVGADAGSG
jgi:hypothetical protein